MMVKPVTTPAPAGQVVKGIRRAMPGLPGRRPIRGPTDPRPDPVRRRDLSTRRTLPKRHHQLARLPTLKPQTPDGSMPQIPTNRGPVEFCYPWVWP